jgi:hypothetical protein
MPRWVWPAALLIVIGGAVAGFLSVPHYRPPHQADEARLRARAVALYRASRRFDMAAMAKLYTPAHQLQSGDKLRKLVDKLAQDAARATPAAREATEAAARSVTADKLKLRLEGDWAVTTGRFTMPGEHGKAGVEVPLEPIVWVRTDGDWWVYLLEPDELSCYGNPPDFARNIVATRKFDPTQAGAIAGAPEAQPPAAAPASGAGRGQ